MDVLYYIVGINVLTFLIYGLDKWLARRRLRRISERTLLSLAFVGGALGAWVGMKLWRHKTLHRQFALGVPLMLALHIGLIVYYAFFAN